jgi:hypothetical protein
MVKAGTNRLPLQHENDKKKNDSVLMIFDNRECHSQLNSIQFGVLFITRCKRLLRTSAPCWFLSKPDETAERDECRTIMSARFSIHVKIYVTDARWRGFEFFVCRWTEHVRHRSSAGVDFAISLYLVYTFVLFINRAKDKRESTHREREKLK